MQKFLTNQQRKELRTQHKIERDRNICDRIKAVVLADDGVTFTQIARVLMIDEDTARRHVKAFQDDGVLSIKSGGYEGLLIGNDALKFITALEKSEVPTATHAVSLAKELTGVSFTISGMTSWLKRNGFSWKKAVGSPAKANTEDQAVFIDAYSDLKDNLPEGDVILFMDAAHPTMTTKLGYGWSRKGVRKVVSTTGAKKRLNVLGSLNLESLKLTVSFPVNVDSNALKSHFKQIRQAYPLAKHQTIHLVLDQGPYNRSKETVAAAQHYRIRLCFLPPYSPNLNIIERMWKLMNELVRNNVYFPTFAVFESSIKDFFMRSWRKLKHNYRERFKDTFETLKAAY